MLYHFASTALFRGTTTAVTAHASPYGRGTELRAQVVSDTAEPATPAGTVQFYVYGTRLGWPVTVAHGSAAISLRARTAGSHVITGVYSGDNYYNTSTSAPVRISG